LEPITHFLTGACLARAGFNRQTALATATMTLAAEAPDLDVLGRIRGPVFGFAHHRGFTHSFLGLILVSASVVGLIYLIWRMRGRNISDPARPPRWGRLFLLAYLAGLSHILLDYTNNYGVRPFWPFSEKWYSWDIVFIVEPVLLILLIAGLVLPALFAWAGNSSSAVPSGPRGRLAATLALTGVVALWGLRDFEHGRAIQLLRFGSPIRASAYPYWWTPFRWHSVAEEPGSYAIMTIDSLSGRIEPIQIYLKPAESAATLAARRTYLGRVYLDWAQYPVLYPSEVKGSDTVAYRVEFVDLRYASPGIPGRISLSASVALNRQLEPVGQSFGGRP
jgi:inner membrane protein